jgi:hypothetical protein
MTKDPAHTNESAAEHSEIEGPIEQADRPSGPVRQEQYQRTREKRRAAKTRWTGTPEYADGRTKSGSKKDDRKV